MNKLKILEQWQTTTDALDKASDHLIKFGMSIESEHEAEPLTAANLPGSFARFTQCLK